VARLASWSVLVCVVGCALRPAHAEDLVLFATSSTAKAMEAVAEKFTEQTQLQVAVEAAAPGAFVWRIEAGEAPHVVVLDGKKWMDRLVAAKSVVADTRRQMFSNRLVMATHRDFPHTIQIAPEVPLRNLLGDGKFAIADPAVDPAGELAQAALQSIKVLRQIEPKLVLRQNVQAAVAAIYNGDDNVEAGIVYATDVRTVKDVVISGVFLRSMHPPIVYEIAVGTAKDGPAARRLHAHLLSREARNIFTAHGFVLE
jgi:molybdate transport system substrate-binding protein